MTLRDLYDRKIKGDISRRDLLLNAAKSSVLVAAVTSLPGCGGILSDNNGGGGGPSDIDVLNFALNLEYLEAEFYAFALNGASGLTLAQTTGVGSLGATTGGQQVTLDSEVAAITAEIRQDEIEHVLFLRSALGSAAVAKPAINLNALGIGFGNQDEFLAVARAFEDVGVSAYGGAARFIRNKDFLEAAARILAVEAYHAGNIRLKVVQEGVTSPAVDGQDQPPSTSNYFPTVANGLAIIRTPRQVLDILYASNASQGGFFPSGLNGAIRQ